MAPNPLQNLSPGHALRIIVDFAQADLNRLPPRQIAAVERRVQAFIHRESPPTRLQVGQLDRRHLTELQSRALLLLTQVAQRQRLAAIAGDLVLSFFALREAAAVRVQVLGSPRDLLLYQVIRVLEAVGAEKLRACRAPRPLPRRPGEPAECGRIFLKITSKTYCSARCQSRVYMRHKRERDREADREELARLQREAGRHGKSTRTR